MSQDKIIDIFRNLSSNNDESQRKFFKGFPYVKISKDESGNILRKEVLKEYAEKCFYIVSVMKSNGIGVSLYKYKVPYNSLLDFLNEFRTNKNYGEIVDIERYIPEDLA